VRMKIGFLIEGEGNSLISCFADSPGREVPASASSRSNGGYGFYLTTNATKTRLVNPRVYLGNSGDTLPATETITPIFVDQSEATIIGPQFKSGIGGVSFASPDIAYDASYTLQSTILGRGTLIQPNFWVNFTPILNFGGATTGITYSASHGRACYVSNDLVYFELFINLSSKGSATGTATITGLPYTSRDQDTNRGLPFIVHVVSLGSATTMYATLANNSTILTLRSYTTQSALTDSVFGASTKITISGHYRDNSLAGL
jgi:hypothetical protein